MLTCCFQEGETFLTKAKIAHEKGLQLIRRRVSEVGVEQCLNGRDAETRYGLVLVRLAHRLAGKVSYFS